MANASVNSCAVIELYQNGMSIPEVSREVGIPMSTIRRRLLKANVLRSVADGISNAVKRGTFCATNRGKKRPPFSVECRHRMSLAKTARGKGVSIKTNGYIEITMGENKFRSQHVVLMEQHIGRKITRGECVHHMDGNKHNNDLGNLQLMTKKEHSRLHATENLSNIERNEYGQFKPRHADR